eukprot:m.79891 g.79891  ORF g.79891 m.79891 type:complete len:349 (-) comp9314_c0_seq1:916-1962(-)
MLMPDRSVPSRSNMDLWPPEGSVATIDGGGIPAGGGGTTPGTCMPIPGINIPGGGIIMPGCIIMLGGGIMPGCIIPPAIIAPGGGIPGIALSPATPPAPPGTPPTGVAESDTRICRPIISTLFIFSTAICAAADTSNSTNPVPDDPCPSDSGITSASLTRVLPAASAKGSNRILSDCEVISRGRLATDTRHGPPAAASFSLSAACRFFSDWVIIMIKGAGPRRSPFIASAFATESGSTNSTYAIPLDRRELRSAMSLASRTLPALAKCSMRSAGLQLRGSCMTITVRMSRSTSVRCGDGDRSGDRVLCRRGDRDRDERRAGGGDRDERRRRYPGDGERRCACRPFPRS